MSNTPLASVIVPNWNGAHLLGACLASLRVQRYPRVEVVVVDGASRDGSVELVSQQFPEVKLIRLPTNRGFTGNVNAGLQAAGGNVLALLNNDAEAEPAWLDELVTALTADDRIGSAAAKILHQHDRRTIASAGDLLHRSGRAEQRGNGQPDDGRFDQPIEVFSASGGAVAYRRAMLADVGPFDERFGSYLEDVDLGLRGHLRGWRCHFAPEARVYHVVSATGGGPLASFHVARNTVRLVARGFPPAALRACWAELVRLQLERARDAARAWRGAAARATLRGQLAGLLELPAALRSRQAVQAGRTISDAEFIALLAP